MNPLTRSLAKTVSGLLICAGPVLQAHGRPWQLLPCRLTIPERGPVTGYHLIADQRVYTFLPPEHWRLRLDPDRKTLRVVAPDSTAQISLTLFPNRKLPPLAATNAWRTLIAREYLGATVTETFSAYCANQSGPAFDLKQRTMAGNTLRRRVAFFSLPPGTIEFRLSTSATTFPKRKLFFSWFLSSFQVESAAKSKRLKKSTSPPA